MIDTASNVVVATVTVGDDPLGAAVNATGTRAYVANQVTPIGSVSVIDTTQNGVVGTVTVGSGPSGVAAKLPGDRVYVTNRDDKTVSVIDTAQLVVVATVPVGNNPLGIAVNPVGSPAYAVNKGSNSVSVIDTTTNTVIATIPVGNDPSHVTVSPTGHRVYVTNGSNASVSVIDSASNSVLATVQVGNIPEGVTVDPLGARVYVANSGPNSVSVIDTATNTVVDTVSVGMTPSELAFRPDGARLFVINRQGGNVSVVNPANKAVTSVEVGFGPTGLGQFIEPALVVPRFGTVARKCQILLAKQAAKFAKLHLGLETKCQLGLIKAEAAGKGTAKAEAACLKGLDLGNPTSKLSKARVKARAAIARRCANVAPRQINAPCDGDAVDFNATGDCILAKHLTRVVAMRADEFSATRPTPLGAGARSCQGAIVKNARRVVDRAYRDLGKCLEKTLVAADTGKDEFKAVSSCLTTLDLDDPLAKATLARAKAVAGIVTACVGTNPADLGSPCDPAAATIAATASCIVDGHIQHVAKLLAADFNDACVLLTRLGLGPVYLRACTGP